MQPELDKRRGKLASKVARAVRSGWRVESQDAFQAVLVKGRRTNHILHLLLSIITVGVWLPVWILLGIFGGEKRKVIHV